MKIVINEHERETKNYFNKKKINLFLYLLLNKKKLNQIKFCKKIQNKTKILLINSLYYFFKFFTGNARSMGTSFNELKY